MKCLICKRPGNPLQMLPERCFHWDHCYFKSLAITSSSSQSLIGSRPISLPCLVQCIDCLTMIGPIHSSVDCSSLLKKISCLTAVALPPVQTCNIVLGVGHIYMFCAAACRRHDFYMNGAMFFVLGCSGPSACKYIECASRYCCRL